MKFGFCIGGSATLNGKKQRFASYGNIKEASDFATKSGYDFIECNLGDVMNFTEEEAERASREMPLYAIHGFLPSRLYTGYPMLTAYAKKAFTRMKKVGIKIAVFGSGRHRKIIIPFLAGIEHKMLEKYLTTIEEYARENGVTIVLEPLNKKETNVLNTYKESVELAKKLSLPNLKVLADSYHVAKVNEPLANIAENKDYLYHVHIAEPQKRGVPGTEDGAYLKNFFKTLKDIGYEGSVSVEAHTADYDTDIPLSIKTIKEMVNE